MKKLFIVLLSLFLIFAFAACGQQEAPVEEEPAAEELQPLNVGMLSRNAVDQEEFTQLTETTSPAKEGFYRNCIYYDDMTSMLLALDKGDIDYLYTIQENADYVVASLPDTYSIYPTEHINTFSMAAMESKAELIQTVNTALAALEADGTLAALQSEYLENCDPANMPAPTELPRFEGTETVRVVVTGDLPPMDYMTTGGQAAGYNIALLSAIARQAQINFELVSANSGSRALMLTSDKADLAFWSVSFLKDGQPSSEYDLPAGMISTTPYFRSSGVGLYLTGAGK